MGVKKAADGDLHITFRTGGKNLVVEFMPRDRGHLPSAETLSNFKKHSTQLRMTGAFVCDTNHGDQELHPVFRVQQLGFLGRVVHTWTSGPQFKGKLYKQGPGKRGSKNC